MFKKTSLFIALFFIGPLFACIGDIDTTKYPQIALFIEKYRCSAELEALVAEHSEYVEKLGNSVLKYTNIPYFNKGAAFDRLKNAKRLEKVIVELGLQRVRVAQKWLCKGSSGWFVLAERIESKQALYPFSQQEMAELLQLTEMTGYADYARFYNDYTQNIVRDEQGYLVIIDTEDRGFGFSGRQAAASIIESMLGSHRFSHESVLDLTLSMRQWLERYREELLFSGIQTFIPTLPNNNRYDDPEINSEILELEYACLQKEIDIEKCKQEHQVALNKLKIAYEALLAKIMPIK